MAADYIFADDPAEASTSRPSRSANRIKMKNAIADDIAVKDPPAKKRRRKTGPKNAAQSKGKGKATEDQNTDPEDDDFSGSGSDRETDDEDSDASILAESLPTKTIAENARRTAKAPPRKKRKAAEAPLAPSNTESNATAGPSTAGSSQQPQPPAPAVKSKKSNPIYLFYEDPTDYDATGEKDEGAKYYKCYLGNREIVKLTKGSNQNTNKLRKHLEKTSEPHFQLFQVLQKRSGPVTDHERSLACGTTFLTPEIIAEYVQEGKKISNDIKAMFEKQAAEKQIPWNQDHFEGLVAKWVAACDQPFIAVNKPEFCEMLQYVHHHSPKPLQIPGDDKVRSLIEKMSDDMVTSLKKIFEANESNFVLSLDAWTSSNGYAFMAVIIHYIGNDGKLEECLIDFRELSGQHSGENMAAAVWETVDKFGLIGRIIAFVMDNATNNDTLVQSFARRCQKEGINFSTTDGRMRCMPHTIHLSALKLLEAIGALTKEEKRAAKSRSPTSAYQDSATEPLGRDVDGDIEDLAESRAVFKLRKIVRHVRSSPQRRRKWEADVLRGSEGSKPLILILDVKTRWSSTHQMLRRALDLRKGIFTYVGEDGENPDLTPYTLSATEWAALTQVTDWLEAYRYATTKMSATKQPMLSTTHACFRWLQDHLKTTIAALPQSAEPTLRDGLVAAHRKLSDYYTKFDESRYYSWATLLDPRLSYEGLRRDYADDPELLAGLETAKNQLQVHYNTHYANTNTAVSQQQLPPGSPVKFNIFARYGPQTGSTDSAKNELAEYFRLTNNPPSFEDTDPLKWWYMRRNKFPKLYRLARDMLCIPGSAVAVERIFSSGRDTIGLRRSRLKAETIRILMFVKARLRVERGQSKKRGESV
ncbi:Transposase-like protein [Mycena venus]|uniref:Transposase-like protein n=1 Tax=Mycena venus TaxID=2733690 RepID=A0A8H6XUI0_9AGAR|nr:Transposase-like protein [Mycena venus]